MTAGAFPHIGFYHGVLAFESITPGQNIDKAES